MRSVLDSASSYSSTSVPAPKFWTSSASALDDRGTKSSVRVSANCSSSLVTASPPRPELGVFGPDSVTWRISRETAVLLGGGSRALLLQVAHPKVAAAVDDHSRYRSDPLGRLRDTLDAIYAFTFADVPT